MAGCRRNGSVITKSGSTLAVGANYLVNVLAPGGIATSPASGATIFLEHGHGFSVGHKVMIHSISAGTFTYLPGSAISISDPSFVTLGGVVPVFAVADGDVIFNMAADNSPTATPNFNGNGAEIFEEIALEDPVANQLVQADTNGAYGYFWSGARVWEVFRSPSSGLVLAYEIDISSGSAADASGTALPAQGDFPGQTFYLRATPPSQGGLLYAWAEDATGAFNWVEVIGG